MRGWPPGRGRDFFFCPLMITQLFSWSARIHDSGRHGLAALAMWTWLALLLLVAASGCTTPHGAATGAQKSTFDAARALAGEWEDSGDHTIEFTPARGTFRNGTVTGLWAEGGTYTVVSTDDAARALRLIAATGDPADAAHQHLTAEVSFSADGREMTLTRHLSRRVPPQTVVYHRMSRDGWTGNKPPIAIWPGRGY